MQFLLQFFLTAAAVIVIILVMLQKGKGGGLAGALGGMGGQSAFGTKAGDLFTKITVGVAAFWILISILAAMYAPNLAGNQMNVTQNSQVNTGLPPAAPDASKPADSAAGKADKGGTLPEKPVAPSSKPPVTTPPTAPPATPPAKAPPANTPSAPASK